MDNCSEVVSREVERTLDAPHAHIELRHYHFAQPPNGVLRSDKRFQVELFLTPQHRSARACFSGLWSHSYEHIGALYVLPPRMDVLVRSDEIRSLTSVLCQVDADALLRLLYETPEAADLHPLVSLDVKLPTIRSSLLRLGQELRQPGFASRVLVESIVHQMMVELFRRGPTHGGKMNNGGLAPWQLRVIEERLREVTHTPTLAELSKLCRISVRQLSRGFRGSRGCTIGAYVTNSQLEHAKRLLAAGDSVISIAKTLGFSSPSNFCSSFRRAMGTPPGHFRQNILAEHAS